MIVLNENSYVTLIEAEEYIKSHFTSGDEYRVKWESLSDEDKEIWLIKSTQALNCLKYVGRKKGVQKFEFPRVKNFGFCGAIPNLYVSQYYDNGLISGSGPANDENGMEAIKSAVIENAIAGCNLLEISQTSRVANIQGLTAMKAGSVSKTYNRSNKATLDIDRGIYTSVIYNILVDWLQSSRNTI